MRKLLFLIIMVAFLAVIIPPQVLAEPPTGNNDLITPDGADGDNPIGDPPIVPPWDDPWGPGSKPVVDNDNSNNIVDQPFWLRTDLIRLMVKIQGIRLIVMK